jgi:hypothetical protein
MEPPHPHVGVNFVQPSPIQQYQNFEQMNTENLTHPSNNAKNKEMNRNNNNPGQGGNQPQQNQPTRGNQNQGNQNPRGEITIGVKGEITILLKPPSLVPFAVSSVIILIISPKSLILNG